GTYGTEDGGAPYSIATRSAYTAPSRSIVPSRLGGAVSPHAAPAAAPAAVPVNPEGYGGRDQTRGCLEVDHQPVRAAGLRRVPRLREQRTAAAVLHRPAVVPPV